MNKRKNEKLLEALNIMLELAENKLKRAKEKNNTWDIEHYTNDVAFIKSEINLVK